MNYEGMYVYPETLLSERSKNVHNSKAYLFDL